MNIYDINGKSALQRAVCILSDRRCRSNAKMYLQQGKKSAVSVIFA